MSFRTQLTRGKARGKAHRSAFIVSVIPSSALGCDAVSTGSRCVCVCVHKTFIFAEPPHPSPFLLTDLATRMKGQKSVLKKKKKENAEKSSVTVRGMARGYRTGMEVIWDEVDVFTANVAEVCRFRNSVPPRLSSPPRFHLF